MRKNLKLLISSLTIALTFALPQAMQGMEKEFADGSAFKGCHKEIKTMILHRAAIDECLINRSPVYILLVCKEWRNLIEKEFIDASGKTVKKLCQEAWYGVPGHEDIYERFLKGVLIYRPKPGSDEGRIDLPIAALVNPLKGTFDLSQCGGTGNHLSISTGYRKGKKPENASKFEIWIAPRFLIEKKLSATAAHFKPIMDNWKQELAPVGLFWTWGGDDTLEWYDYLTTENMDNLFKINLYENWNKSVHGERWYVHARDRHRLLTGLCMTGGLGVSFVN